MKRYEEYKDTHEYGYSQIPHHWDIKPTRAHFSFDKGLNITKANLKESGIAVLSYGQIHSKHNSGIHLKPELIRYVDETYLTSNSQCLLGIGDFVFADTSEDIEGSGNSAYNDSYKILFAGYHTVIARPKDLSCLPYIAYLFKSREWKGQIQKNVNAVKVYSIGRGLIKQTYLLIPPIEEQEAIVAFLDSKISKIDAYIGEREKEIIALGEFKQAEIASVVTRGLNPDVPMRDSGIPWLGKIPVHWHLKQLRAYLKLISDKGHGDKQLLSVTREQGVIIRNVESKEENHNFIPEDLSGYKLIKPGQFAVNKMKSWQGSYGVSEYEGIVSPAYYVCELNFPCKEFFSIAIRSKAYIPFFTQLSKGIRVDQWDLSPIALKSIYFAEPPIEEQQAIVDYIKAKTEKIDGLIADLSAQIEKLKEYKQRLISDAVTGQIDVRDYKPSTSAQ